LYLENVGRGGMNMLPRVVIHNAVSLDGSIRLRSPDLATYYGLARVWKEDATLAGSETILAGEKEAPPEKPADIGPWAVDPDDRRALLVVPDSRGRIRFWHFLRRSGYWRDVVVLCSRSTPVRYLEYLRERHIDCIVTGGRKVDLRSALEVLRTDFGVRTIRVDSGGILNGILLREGLVDEVSLLVHPEVAGDDRPKTFFSGPAIHPERAMLRLFKVQRVKGGLAWLRYRVVH
jgi:2,5-diamino-6-(ribosylamino)-4(3H)-pyrimidinone 5'-phosphate reductase